MGLCKLIVIVGVAALWTDSSNSASIVGHNNLCICTREYAPVCASNGITYSNKCEFECEKRTSKDLTLMFDGDCADQAAVDDSCICNRMYDPVCSNEGKTYPNECVFKCAQKDNHDLKISSFGECAEISNLPLDQEIPEVHNLPMDQEIPQVQQFKPPCMCFKNYEPVCGSDGKTYSNECMLNCAKFETSPNLEMASTGECEDVNTVSFPEVQNLPMDQEFPEVQNLPMDQEIPEVQQFNTPCVCNRMYDPVCGNDGKTYSNKCMLNCAKFETSPNLEMASTGECEEVKTVALKEPMCPCPKIFWPVCASSGKTYANKCLFECAQKTNKKLELIAEGECK